MQPQYVPTADVPHDLCWSIYAKCDSHFRFAQIPVLSVYPFYNFLRFYAPYKSVLSCVLLDFYTSFSEPAEVLADSNTYRFYCFVIFRRTARRYFFFFDNKISRLLIWTYYVPYGFLTLIHYYQFTTCIGVLQDIFKSHLLRFYKYFSAVAVRKEVNLKSLSFLQPQEYISLIDFLIIYLSTYLITYLITDPKKTSKIKACETHRS